MKEFIEAEAATLHALHQQVHASVAARDKSETGMRAWAKAVRAFHSYESGMESLVNRSCSPDLLHYTDVSEFALCFLEVDPMFFRSGFIKQEILRRIDRAPLDDAQMERLQAVILDAVKNRGTREYRCYCRVAARLKMPELAAKVQTLCSSDTPAVRSRAVLMMAYLSPELNDETVKAACRR